VLDHEVMEPRSCQSAHAQGSAVGSEAWLDRCSELVKDHSLVARKIGGEYFIKIIINIL
jgi:hypothetical protein